MDKHTGASYDDKAEEYLAAQETKPWTLFFERPSTLNFLPDVDGLDVLDAACGPGFYARHFVEQGARVVAFDLNPFFVERTRLRTDHRAQVLQADLAEPLTFCADSSIDLVVSILALHYLRDWLPTLREFQRVLRPGGGLIFSTHHPFTDLEMAVSDDYFATELLEDEWDIGKVTFYRRSISTLTHDLFQAGFVIEVIDEPKPIQPPDGVEFRWYERALKRPQRLFVRARKPKL